MCRNCDNRQRVEEANNQMGTEVGKAIGEAVVGGFGILGRGTILLARGLANGTSAAARGIADEYKRQQKEGFSHKDECKGPYVKYGKK